MSVSYKITIPQVDVRLSDDTIRVVHWRVRAWDDTVINPDTSAPYQVVVYGTENVPEDTNVAYGSVTKTQIVNWLKNRPTSKEGVNLGQEVVAKINSAIADFSAPVSEQRSKTELSNESDL